MSRSGLLLTPFYSSFARPASLGILWALAMALCGSLLQLDQIAFSMAFTGSAPVGTDARLVAETARTLVIHGSALLGAAIGLIVLVNCGELEDSPRLAVAPGFHQSMRNGTLSLMLFSPALIWLWAYRWASADSLLVAMLWMPWWISIGFWHRSLLSAPRAVRALPFALLLLVALRPREYVSIVSHIDWRIAALLLVPAVYAVRRRWSAGLRTTWMDTTNDGARMGSFRDWIFDRSNRLEIRIGPATQRSVRWWTRYLLAERAENQRLSFSWATLCASLTIFFFVTGTTPLLLFMNLASAGRAVGQSLNHPVSRRERAQLQYLEQLRDIGLVGLIAGTTYALCDRVGMPRFSLAAHADVPFFVALAAGLAMSPVTQFGRATMVQPVRQTTPNSVELTKWIGAGFTYMISAMTVMMSVWYWSQKNALVTVQWLLAIGVVMQIVCYFALRRYFASANLSPMAS